jgi:hypothetical protein
MRLKYFWLIIFILIFFNCKKERPPKAPVVSGPSKGYTNQPIDFTVSTTDPNKDDVAYLFNWGDGTSDSWTIYYVSGQKITKSHTFSKPGNYDVCAKAKDTKGMESEWSAFHTISISSQPPNIPSVPSGPNTVGVGVFSNFSSSATDPDSDSVAIRFDWGDGNISNWSNYVPSGQSVTMGYSWLNAGVYFVKAQAKDKYGNESNWSESLAVTIIVNQPPNTPSTPVGPYLGFTDTIYYFSSSATDPDGDSIAIRFDWGDGTISEWSRYVPSGRVVWGSHTYLNSGLYYVKAQAKDKYGDTSAWSYALDIYIAEVIMTEDFEVDFPGTKWTLSGTPTWDDESYRPYRGYWSGWCAGSTRNPPGPYPSNMNAWMVYGPFSLLDATEAYLDFYYWLDSEANYDYLFFGASVDGINFYGYRYSGRWQYWDEDYLDLTAVPTLGNLCGRPQVWIAFRFTSDGSVCYEGAYLDDIVLYKYRGPYSFKKVISSKEKQKEKVKKIPAFIKRE